MKKVHFNNLDIGQYLMTGVPVKVYVNGQHLAITDMDDVSDPTIGFGMDPSGEMKRFDYRFVTQLSIGGNPVDIETYNNAMASKFTDKAEEPSAGENEEPSDEEEGGEDMPPEPEGGSGGEGLDDSGELDMGSGEGEEPKKEESIRKSNALLEKAVSKSQQRAAGIALAVKRGELPKSMLTGASKEMFKMSEKDLEDFAKTKHNKLPKKVEEMTLYKKRMGQIDINFLKNLKKKGYGELFKAALKKAGKSIPQMSDSEKKEFFNKIDKAWKAKNESINEKIEDFAKTKHNKLPKKVKEMSLYKKMMSQSINEVGGMTPGKPNDAKKFADEMEYLEVLAKDMNRHAFNNWETSVADYWNTLGVDNWYDAYMTDVNGSKSFVEELKSIANMGAYGDTSDDDLWEITKDELDAELDSLEAQIDAAKAKEKLAKKKMQDLKKQPIDEAVQYTYGTGDIVKNKEKDCPYKDSIGMVKGTYLDKEGTEIVTYRIMNWGEKYKSGDTVTVPKSYLKSIDDEAVTKEFKSKELDDKSTEIKGKK